ncbi:MAG TPA: tripartite tricarboxylate transporter substrate-binding protein [Burkholderiaceae bacterium]|jgi:tripartite-type tricarboxylate transporter receptor subunit TctC
MRPAALNRLAARLCALGLAGVAALASAQGYPDKVIRLVVPFAAGGTSDVMVRPLTDKLTKLLGQSVVADYAAGAGGTVAATRVAVAAPDGYTLLLASTSALSTGPFVTKGLRYDPVKSFTPIGQMARSEYILVVPARSPLKNLDDVLKAARAKPGALTYGTPGVGSLGHLSGELLKSRTGIQIEHVPYRGQGPMDIDLLGGRLDMAIAGLGNTIESVNDGRLRAIAMTGGVRSGALPQVATMSELGVPDFDASVFWGLVGPAGMAPDVVDKLNAALRAVVQMPDVKRFWIAEGQDPVAGSPAELGSLIEREYARWKVVTTNAHIAP